MLNMSDVIKNYEYQYIFLEFSLLFLLKVKLSEIVELMGTNQINLEEPSNKCYDKWIDSNILMK